MAWARAAFGLALEPQGEEVWLWQTEGAAPGQASGLAEGCSLNGQITIQTKELGHSPHENRQLFLTKSRCFSRNSRSLSFTSRRSRKTPRCRQTLFCSAPKGESLLLNSGTYKKKNYFQQSTQCWARRKHSQVGYMVGWFGNSCHEKVAEFHPVARGSVETERTPRGPQDSLRVTPLCDLGQGTSLPKTCLFLHKRD